MGLFHGVPATVPVVEVEEAEEDHLQDERSPNLLLDSAHFLSQKHNHVAKVVSRFIGNREKYTVTNVKYT